MFSIQHTTCTVYIERALVSAGIKFAQCDYDSAVNILSKCLDEAKEQDEKLKNASEWNPWESFAPPLPSNTKHTSDTTVAEAKGRTRVSFSATVTEGVNDSLVVEDSTNANTQPVRSTPSGIRPQGQFQSQQYVRSLADSINDNVLHALVSQQLILLH